MAKSQKFVVNEWMFQSVCVCSTFVAGICFKCKCLSAANEHVYDNDCETRQATRPLCNLHHRQTCSTHHHREDDDDDDDDKNTSAENIVVYRLWDFISKKHQEKKWKMSTTKTMRKRKSPNNNKLKCDCKSKEKKKKNEKKNSKQRVRKLFTYMVNRN